MLIYLIILELNYMIHILKLNLEKLNKIIKIIIKVFNLKKCNNIRCLLKYYA